MSAIQLGNQIFIKNPSNQNIKNNSNMTPMAMEYLISASFTDFNIQ